MSIIKKILLFPKIIAFSLVFLKDLNKYENRKKLQKLCRFKPLDIGCVILGLCYMKSKKLLRSDFVEKFTPNRLLLIKIESKILVFETIR